METVKGLPHPDGEANKRQGKMREANKKKIRPWICAILDYKFISYNLIIFFVTESNSL